MDKNNTYHTNYVSQVNPQGRVVSFGARVSNLSWHVGGERAPLPPSLVLHASLGFADPLAAPAPLDPGSGDLSAGHRSPAGSVC